MDETLEERLQRLDRERIEADRIYNDALTALDRALPGRTGGPPSPAAFDSTKLPDLNETWNILPKGTPAIDGSLKGRLRGFIWRLIGPSLEQQRQFNAVLVEHLNRNVAACEQTQAATAALVATSAEHIEAQVQFQSHLIRLFQTLTLYVDTKDRSVAGRQDVLNAGLSAITDTWLKRWESLNAREQRFVNRLASIDDVRHTATLAQQTALSLKREVERFLATAAPFGGVDQPAAAIAAAPPDLDAFKYLGFEDQFRGSQEDISRRLAEYVPLFAGQTDVLDIGCGRGEFLDLLRAAGIRARGLDINHAMVEASRARGLDVAKGDALGYLNGLPDASLGGLFAAQVVEHLPPDYLSQLLEVAGHKVRPGGRIVLETINPACWLAFFESYIRDLSHVRPIHPETLQYMLRVSGFHDVSIAFKSPVSESEKMQALGTAGAEADPALTDLVETFNENMAKINARLFTFQDYAAIGTKA